MSAFRAAVGFNRSLFAFRTAAGSRSMLTFGPAAGFSQSSIFSSRQAASSNRSMLARHFATATAGPREKKIYDLLSSTLQPTHLEVLNTSHGRRSDESHFKVVVVSDKFVGVPLVKRHRMVTSAITNNSGNLDFHSLEIASAVTPEQWSANNVVRPSPKCAGNRK